MIQSVTVENPKGEKLKMVLTKPELCGLIVENIEGLGPSHANINTYELATTDGGIFSGARQESRQIILTLRMMALEHLSIEQSRLLTYHYFPIKKKVRLIIETDVRTVECEGYVESNEPVVFSDQESTVVTLNCPDPFFYHGHYSEKIFSGVEPIFEFPFENNSLTENLIEFGELRLDTRATINYPGDVDTGMLITIHFIGTATNITLYNTDTREKMGINTQKIADLTSGAVGAGDDILINTKRGERYARLLRNGVYTNVISAIDKDADWMQLSVGDNTFAFTAETGDTNVVMTLTYRAAYGGV